MIPPGMVARGLPRTVTSRSPVFHAWAEPITAKANADRPSLAPPAVAMLSGR